MFSAKIQIKNVLRYVCCLILLLAFAMTPTASAGTCATNANQQSCSGTYGVNEVLFGSGGQYACSGNQYCAKQSAGETAVGNTQGTAFQAQAGFNTDRYPSLTFIVPAQNINLGVLTPGTTATATATFSVKSYLTSGYVVQTVGAGMQDGSYTLHNMTSVGASNPSTEQFGINLRANTSPNISGSADPSQSPDATFGFGQAAPGYNTVNQFKYNNGDVIAQSLKSSGTTNYTISYILNTTALTPGGTYSMSQVLVATATY